jgi:SAM-dependent methyltransferase
MAHSNFYYSLNNNQFDYGLDDGFWVGGRYYCSNLSNGYHGILKQYWELYTKKEEAIDVLLISENNKVKKEFNITYPNWNIKTLDLYYNLTDSVPDIIGDVCSNVNPIVDTKFDLILNQATLEHLYNPFKCMENLISSLKKDGVLVSHTHPPAFPYHSFPRDYFRFMIDWWLDLPKYIADIQLMELCMYSNSHVFSVYKKLH